MKVFVNLSEFYLLLFFFCLSISNQVEYRNEFFFLLLLLVRCKEVNELFEGSLNIVKPKKKNKTNILHRKRN